MCTYRKYEYTCVCLWLCVGIVTDTQKSSWSLTNFMDPYSQSYGFPVVMYGCEKHKESWVPKNWCFWTVVLGKTLESPLDLDCKEIKPANPKGNQSWIFIGRTDTEAEALIFCHLMWRTDSSETTLLLGKIEGRRRRGWQRMRWLDGITDSTDMSMRKL